MLHAVVYDMNGREASDVEPVLNAVGDIEQYIFCSSAGVYLKSDQMPHREEDATDPKSRHKVNAVLPHLAVTSSCNTVLSCHFGLPIANVVVRKHSATDYGC